MRVVAVITARGGSKGIPYKNLAPVGGLPLVAWTVEAARASRLLDRVIVSTDDPAIADVCRAYGAEVPFMRPAEFARDDSPHIDVITHALAWLAADEGRTPDYVLTLQPTSPLRTADDIDAAILLARERTCDAVVGVTPMRHHPHFALRVGPGGTLYPCAGDRVREARRQDLPPVFVPNGAIYLNRSHALLVQREFVPNGAVPLVMAAERSIDVDEPADLELAEFYLARREGRARSAPTAPSVAATS